MSFGFFTRAFFVSLISAVCFGGLALFISDWRITQFDHTVIQAIQGMENPVLTGIMIFFTRIGTGVPYIAIAACAGLFLYKVLGHRRELVLFVAVLAGSGLLNALLKHIFRRARPVIHRIIEANGYSFPSGHSMAAFSMYGILVFLLWKHGRTRGRRLTLLTAGTFFILMIGVSRIYLGVHYPSDVVGGYLASACWIAALIWFYQRSLDIRKKSPYKQTGH